MGFMLAFVTVLVGNVVSAAPRELPSCVILPGIPPATIAAAVPLGVVAGILIVALGCCAVEIVDILANPLSAPVATLAAEAKASTANCPLTALLSGYVGRDTGVGRVVSLVGV
jgi:hypothetical protein